MAVDLKRPDRSHADPQDEGEIERLTIKPSKNGGFAVECERRMMPKMSSAKGYEPMAYRPPETYTFESLASLQAHLDEMFGGGDGMSPDGDAGMRGGMGRMGRGTDEDED